MPRRDDFDDDDRPRRRPRDDDDYDRPRQRPRDEDDEDDLGPPPRRRKGNLGLILGIVGGALLLLCGCGGFGLYYATTGVRGAADRMTSSNNLKQIALATHNYHDQYNDLPNNSYGPNGKPLLSWRVHLLPYLEEDGLYKQFKLDEPWDSPNNIRLLNQMPLVYATPDERRGRAPRGNKTYYCGFSSPGALFARRDQGAARPPTVGGHNQPLAQSRLMLTQITDGMANTILFVEAGDPVEWTKPDDLDASPGKPFPKLGGVRPKDDVIMAAFVDGSVRPIKRTASEAYWRAAITYNGNEIVNPD